MVDECNEWRWTGLSNYSAFNFFLSVCQALLANISILLCPERAILFLSRSLLLFLRCAYCVDGFVELRSIHFGLQRLSSAISIVIYNTACGAGTMESIEFY